MSAFWSYTVVGIATGAIYAVTASGLVVTYATTGVFNFAHGAIGMFAAFSYWELTQNHHLQPLLAVALILFVGAPLLGALIEFVLMRRLHGASAERSLMVTLGLMLILLGLASTVWGDTPGRTGIPAFFAGHTVRILGVNITVQQLIVLGTAVVVAGALRLVLKRTRIGVAMRAVVDDPELIAMAGAPPVRIARAGWVAGVMLAALAGVLIAPLVTLDQTTLTLIVVNGYAAAVVGRLRNLPLTFVGGLAIGLGEAYVVGYVPLNWQSSWLPNPALALPMAFLFVVILVHPGERLRAVGEVRVSRVPKVTKLRESLVGAGAVVAAGVAGTLVLSGTWRATVSQGLVFGVIALSLVLLTGYAGQVSLGQMAFVGIGAYTMGKIAGGGSWLGMLTAVGVSAAVGALIAWPTVRVKGIYLALATLAFAQFAYYVFFSNLRLFNDNGSIVVHRVALPGIKLTGANAELVFLSVVFALSRGGSAGTAAQHLRAPAGGAVGLTGRVCDRGLEDAANATSCVRAVGRSGRTRWRSLRGTPGAGECQRLPGPREPHTPVAARDLGRADPDGRAGRGAELRRLARAPVTRVVGEQPARARRRGRSDPRGPSPERGGRIDRGPRGRPAALPVDVGHRSDGARGGRGRCTCRLTPPMAWDRATCG